MGCEIGLKSKGGTSAGSAEPALWVYVAVFELRSGAGVRPIAGIGVPVDRVTGAEGNVKNGLLAAGLAGEPEGAVIARQVARRDPENSRELLSELQRRLCAGGSHSQGSGLTAAAATGEGDARVCACA